MYEKDITENEINKFKFKYLREQKKQMSTNWNIFKILVQLSKHFGKSVKSSIAMIAYAMLYMDCIHCANLFIDTHTMLNTSKTHSLIRQPYLTIIASNEIFIKST